MRIIMPHMEPDKLPGHGAVTNTTKCGDVRTITTFCPGCLSRYEEFKECHFVTLLLNFSSMHTIWLSDKRGNWDIFFYNVHKCLLLRWVGHCNVSILVSVNPAFLNLQSLYTSKIQVYSNSSITSFFPYCFFPLIVP